MQYVDVTFSQDLTEADCRHKLTGLSQTQGQNLHVSRKVSTQHVGNFRRADKMESKGRPVDAVQQREHVLFSAAAGICVCEIQNRNGLRLHRLVTASSRH